MNDSDLPGSAPPSTTKLQAGTGRPLAAYPKKIAESERYVDAFSRALGLKPTPTLFGDKVRDV
jgi:hypothetical protein